MGDFKQGQNGSVLHHGIRHKNHIIVEAVFPVFYKAWVDHISRPSG